MSDTIAFAVTWVHFFMQHLNLKLHLFHLKGQCIVQILYNPSIKNDGTIQNQWLFPRNDCQEVIGLFLRSANLNDPPMLFIISQKILYKILAAWCSTQIFVTKMWGFFVILKKNCDAFPYKILKLCTLIFLSRLSFYCENW